MLRGRVGLLVVLLCVVLAGGVLAASGGISVYVKGQPIAAQAIVQRGVVYLPARAVAEALNVSVEWDPGARAVYVGGPASSARAKPAPATPRMAPRKAPARPQEIQDIVHITRTGKKYHAAGCRYLSKSDIPISRKDAEARGYTPCSVCGGG